MGANEKHVLGPDTEQQYDFAPSTHRALIDTGAEASTTHLPYLLHKFQNIYFEKYMADAGDTNHRSTGFGYLKIFTNDANGAPNRFSMAYCWLASTLRHTVFLPGATVKRHRKRFSGCTAYKNFVTGRGHAALHAIANDADVVVPGKLLRTSLYMEPLVICSPALADKPTPLNSMNVALSWITPLLTRDNYVIPLMARTCPFMSKNLVPLLHLTWNPRPVLLSRSRSWSFRSDVIMKNLASNQLTALT
jgi:hypothetical protein